MFMTKNQIVHLMKRGEQERATMGIRRSLVNDWDFDREAVMFMTDDEALAVLNAVIDGERWLEFTGDSGEYK